jgi:hypothetical protein
MRTTGEEEPVVAGRRRRRAHRAPEAGAPGPRAAVARSFAVRLARSTRPGPEAPPVSMRYVVGCGAPRVAVPRPGREGQGGLARAAIPSYDDVRSGGTGGARPPAGVELRGRGRRAHDAGRDPRAPPGERGLDVGTVRGRATALPVVDPFRRGAAMIGERGGRRGPAPRLGAAHGRTPPPSRSARRGSGRSSARGFRGSDILARIRESSPTCARACASSTRCCNLTALGSRCAQRGDVASAWPVFLASIGRNRARPLVADVLPHVLAAYRPIRLALATAPLLLAVVRWTRILTARSPPRGAPRRQRRGHHEPRSASFARSRRSARGGRARGVREPPGRARVPPRRADRLGRHDPARGHLRVEGGLDQARGHHRSSLSEVRTAVCPSTAGRSTRSPASST